MTMLFERLKKQRGVAENDNEGEETALLFAGGGFKGRRCNGCGKYGHKKADYCCNPKNNNFHSNNNGYGNGTTIMAKPNNRFGNYGGYAGNRNGQQKGKQQGFLMELIGSQENVTSVKRPDISGQIVFKGKTLLRTLQWKASNEEVAFIGIDTDNKTYDFDFGFSEDEINMI
jgi:hypothetical protein